MTAVFCEGLSNNGCKECCIQFSGLQSIAPRRLKALETTGLRFEGKEYDKKQPILFLSCTLSWLKSNTCAPWMCNYRSRCVLSFWIVDREHPAAFPLVFRFVTQAGGRQLCPSCMISRSACLRKSALGAAPCHRSHRWPLPLSVDEGPQLPPHPGKTHVRHLSQ